MSVHGHVKEIVDLVDIIGVFAGFAAVAFHFLIQKRYWLMIIPTILVATSLVIGTDDPKADTWVLILVGLASLAVMGYAVWLFYLEFMCSKGKQKI